MCPFTKMSFKIDSLFSSFIPKGTFTEIYFITFPRTTAPTPNETMFIASASTSTTPPSQCFETSLALLFYQCYIIRIFFFVSKPSCLCYVHQLSFIFTQPTQHSVLIQSLFRSSLVLFETLKSRLHVLCLTCYAPAVHLVNTVGENTGV